MLHLGGLGFIVFAAGYIRATLSAGPADGAKISDKVIPELVQDRFSIPPALVAKCFHWTPSFFWLRPFIF